MKTFNIGLIGAGTIGKGVFDALNENGQLIAARSGVDLRIRSICDIDLAVIESFGVDKSQTLLTTTYTDILDSEEIDVVVELIGGIEPARRIISEALNAGKHVVTANKALISAHWAELAETAADNDVLLRYEASVGGAIPVIRALQESFIANKIETVYGILNGTTNYILTQMEERGVPFNEALAEAQEKGFAESDPTLDVNGMDSAHKLVILALLSYGIVIKPSDIFVEGIERIDPYDMELARSWGYSIKLLSIAKRTDKGIQLRVHPSLVKSSHLLSSVKGEDNAVFIKGDLIGSSLLYGKGAGAFPTASSVIGDLVEVARSGGRSERDLFAVDASHFEGSIEKVVEMRDTVLYYYLRFSVIDKPGVLSDISSYLAAHDISIASVTQQERRKGETVPVVILTHEAKESSIQEAIAKIDGRDYVTDKTLIIRSEKE